MSQLGTASITIAMLLTIYGIAASLIGATRKEPALVISGQRATFLTTLTLGIAVFALVAAFLQNDFGISYVAQHSNLSMPRIYTWVAFYAGNEGSLLFVAFALSMMASMSMFHVRRDLGIQRPIANGVLLAILLFFVAVMLFLANPFAELATPLTDGEGINPLLTHPGMFFHPPLQMTGLAAISVPFSLGLAALISGQIDDDWVDNGRVWGLIAWVLLGVGLLLGAWWAYTILGWGGYWAWDPVENAAFMPWLGLTAFIHSIMVQKRRGMFRMWNIALINISFILGAFGIFINRGGPVPSVHSFGASTLGWVFLIFLGASVVVSFGAFIYRFESLKSSTRLESTLSREAAFLVNNFLLLGIAVVTMWGVVFPILSELSVGRTITVGQPFYNQVNGPLILALILLMGVGPILPWRKANFKTLKTSITVPVAITLAITIVAAVGLQLTILPVVIGVFASTLVLTVILQEWLRGTIARHKSTQAGYLIAFLGLIAANRPRYGGYIAHLAIVMLAFGIVGSSFYSQEKDVFMSVGESTSIGPYQLEFKGIEAETFPDRIERVATLEISKDGSRLGELTPWNGVYPSFNMVSTRAGLRSTPIEDLYVIFSEIQPDGQTAAFRVLLNPLVWWMWLAGPFVILGTVVALWPSRQRAGTTIQLLDEPPEETTSNRTRLDNA